MKPLSKKTVDDWKFSLNKTQVLEEEITDRITYIVQTICEIYGVKFETWYFPDANEGELGTLNIDNNNIDICLEIEEQKSLDWVFQFQNSKYTLGYNLRDSFPKKWLFEDFKDELLKGKLLLEKKQEEKKQKRKKKEISISGIKKTALTKLTAKERKALGL